MHFLQTACDVVERMNFQFHCYGLKNIVDRNFCKTIKSSERIIKGWYLFHIIPLVYVVELPVFDHPISFFFLSMPKMSILAIIIFKDPLCDFP